MHTQQLLIINLTNSSKKLRSEALDLHNTYSMLGRFFQSEEIPSQEFTFIPSDKCDL